MNILLFFKYSPAGVNISTIDLPVRMANHLHNYISISALGKILTENSKATSYSPGE